MANGYDSDELRVVMDLVANAPIADANPPQSFFGLYLQAAVRAGIFRQSKNDR